VTPKKAAAAQDAGKENRNVPKRTLEGFSDDPLDGCRDLATDNVRDSAR